MAMSLTSCNQPALVVAAPGAHHQPMMRSTRHRTAWLAGCLLASFACPALDRTRLEMDALQGDGWQAQHVHVALQLDTQPLRAQITIGHATFTGIAEPLRDLKIDCLEVQLLAERFACPTARISGVFPYLGRQQWLGSASYQRSDGALELRLRELQMAGGTGQLQATLKELDWQTRLALQGGSVAELLELAQRFGQQLDLQGTGITELTLNANGSNTVPHSLEWQLKADAMTLNNAAGSVATDMLALQTTGKALRLIKGWQFDAQLNVGSGQGYLEPVFIDFGQHELNLHAQGQWDGATDVRLQQLSIDQHNIVSARAQGRLRLDAADPAPQLAVQISKLQFPGSYATYLQPFLLDSSFKNMNTAGVVSGAVQIQDGAPVVVDLKLQQLHGDDGSDNFRLEQINGEIHWRKIIDEAAEPPRSSLSWQSGSVLGMELGATQLQLELWDTNARIAEATRIPIFNGALAIDAFRVRKAGTPQMAFMLDAVIEPINVAQISKAFGWPGFGGELSGKITRLRMEDGVLTLGATLTAKIFDGDASISDMKLEGVLTQWPRFTANIAFKQLDLEQLTQAFSFGRITGRLSGEVHQLELFNWQPVSFDARLYTPPGDRSRHRISQRAVQNIGSVAGNGGGVAAALQSGFLKFFDDFNYDQLGISCRLSNEVCLMSGVAPAKGGGYYLVKGKSLPRIDVIGNSARVDWPRLVAQLLAVTESEGPVVR
jgi:hypothetical protein